MVTLAGSINKIIRRDEKLSKYVSACEIVRETERQVSARDIVCETERK